MHTCHFSYEHKMIFHIKIIVRIINSYSYSRRNVSSCTILFYWIMAFVLVTIISMSRATMLPNFKKEWAKLRHPIHHVTWRCDVQMRRHSSANAPSLPPCGANRDIIAFISTFQWNPTLWTYYRTLNVLLFYFLSLKCFLKVMVVLKPSKLKR